MIFLIMLAGGLGAVGRLITDTAIKQLRPAQFPLGTLVVNMAGSLILGVVASGWIHPGVLTVVGTGFCGGFTTFSTHSLETFRLLTSSNPRIGILNLVVTVCATLVCVSLGLWIGLLLCD